MPETVEFDDGSYLEMDDNGKIRRRDKDGCMLDVYEADEEEYDDWRDCFDEKAVYYQPDGKHELKSNQLYMWLENLTKNHPDCDVKILNGDDIKDVEFIDR